VNKRQILQNQSTVFGGQKEKKTKAKTWVSDCLDEAIHSSSDSQSEKEILFIFLLVVAAHVTQRIEQTWVQVPWVCVHMMAQTMDARD
jgi:hypothetical protein